MKNAKISNWFLIDASNLVLGRLSTVVSILLRGKTNIEYRPGLYSKNGVIIINAEKIKISGKKNLKKKYYSHSGRPGGLKIQSYQDLFNKFPEKILEKSIKGMLPKNSLGRDCFRRLKVLKGSEHSIINEKHIKIENFDI